MVKIAVSHVFKKKSTSTFSLFRLFINTLIAHKKRSVDFILNICVCSCSQKCPYDVHIFTQSVFFIRGRQIKSFVMVLVSAG